MTDRQAIRAKVFEKRLRRKLAEHPDAIRAFDAALTDDTDLEPGVIPKETWPMIAIGLYLKGVNPFWQREALRGAWAYDSIEVSRIAAAERIPVITLFKVAKFALPEGMPDQVQVWRGTAGIEKQVAERGLSWTNNRGHACYWALFLSKCAKLGKPLLIQRMIPTASIFYFDDSDYMSEVLFDATPEATVDGCESEWLTAARKWREDVPPGQIDPRADWSDEA